MNTFIQKLTVIIRGRPSTGAMNFKTFQRKAHLYINSTFFQRDSSNVLALIFETKILYPL